MKDEARAELTEKPMPPADCECCESGCSSCVWDLYYEALYIWNAQQAAVKKESEESL